MLADGDFEGVLEAARTMGIERCLSTCSGSDLRAVADAARYTGNLDLAERALLALRKRPGPSAPLGAFLLGRHYESIRPPEALRWYDVYLRESPRGTFAPDALAGKMRVMQSMHGPSAAGPVAQEYLRRFPQGPHAKMARQVLGNP
jgi:hypothetical protein